MNRITISEPDKCSAAAILVAAGREKFTLDLQADTSEFDSPFWKIAALQDRSISQSNVKVYFTRLGTTDQPLPAAYGDMVKSWVILDRRSAEGLRRRVDAARMFWEAILNRRQNAESAFSWRTLQDEDLSQAELLMRVTWSESTTYKLVSSLVEFTRFLAARGICPALSYTPQTLRPTDLNRNLISAQEAQRKKLPSDAALMGIADIFHKHATAPADRLRAAAIALLVVAGFRIGELLTLPLDCEIEEVRDGTPRYGLRYYKEKSRGGEKLFAVRWLTPIGAELAKTAIKEIRALTDAARNRARILEQSPTRVPIPDMDGSTRLSASDLARILGMQEVNSVLRIPNEKLPRHNSAEGIYYRVSEFETYLRSHLKRLWTIDRRNGTRQMLSESLLIAFRNFFHQDRTVCPLLVEPLVIRHIADFLGSRNGTKSAFERFNICEADGSFCRMTSHQFRHWLNHIADKGGLPTDLQTRWMGREHFRDTDAYRHATVDERIQWVKDGIRNGQLSGAKANLYFELPPTLRDTFIDAEVCAVHVTALGLCLHDFAVTPCPYHLNCVRGCDDYLRTKGSQQERQNLIQIQNATERALSFANAYSATTGTQVAEPWIRHYQETLNGVKVALAVDDDGPAPEGHQVRPFAEIRRSQ